jgi:hypothetical protein
VIIRLNLHFASHNPLYIDCQSQELGGSVHYQDPPSKLLRLIISLNGNLLSLSNIGLRLAAVDTLKRYSKALEYEYRVKTAALGTLKRYSIISLTLYLE